MIKNLMGGLNQLLATCVLKRSRYRAALDELPDTLFDNWRVKAKKEFPGIPCDAVFFARAAVGLMIFFDCVATSRKACGLPSKAADSVWHVWLELDPSGLERFCRKHFRRAIPHIPMEDMSLAKDYSLANCLVAARRLEGLMAASSDLPALFELDARLRMPQGYGYCTCDGKVGFSSLNRKGRFAERMSYPDALLSASLLGAGQVSTREYEAYMARLQAKRSARSAGGSACGSTGGGDCSDGGGGCSCGSSCGSSCGGGCGGGD